MAQSQLGVVQWSRRPKSRHLSPEPSLNYFQNTLIMTRSKWLKVLYLKSRACLNYNVRRDFHAKLSIFSVHTMYIIPLKLASDRGPHILYRKWTHSPHNLNGSSTSSDTSHSRTRWQITCYYWPRYWYRSRCETCVVWKVSKRRTGMKAFHILLFPDLLVHFIGTSSASHQTTSSAPLLSFLHSSLLSPDMQLNSGLKAHSDHPLLGGLYPTRTSTAFRLCSNVRIRKLCMVVKRIWKEGLIFREDRGGWKWRSSS